MTFWGDFVKKKRSSLSCQTGQSQSPSPDRVLKRPQAQNCDRTILIERYTALGFANGALWVLPNLGMNVFLEATRLKFDNEGQLVSFYGVGKTGKLTKVYINH